MKKKDIVFILGGSELQFELVKSVRKKYITYIFDGNDQCALKDEADFFICEDFSNISKIEIYATELNPKFILTIASEIGNYCAAVVSDKLKINYNSPDTVLNTLNKLKMKKILLENNIPTSSLLMIYDGVSKKISDFVDFPVIVKPSQSSAGRGVKLVHNYIELQDACEKAAVISQDNCALVESYFDGKQISIETITSNGKHQIIGITEEFFGEKPYFAETQQIFPFNLDKDFNNKIHNVIIKILNAFNIRFGACHIELRYDLDGNFNVIEIASRIGGWRSELISLALGVNYCDLLINSHAGNEVNIDAKEKKVSAVKMLFSQNCLEKYSQISKKFETKEIIFLKDTYNANPQSLMDSFGYYFIVANNYQELKDAIQ